MEKEIVHWATCIHFQKWIKRRLLRPGQPYIDNTEAKLERLKTGNLKYQTLSKPDTTKIYLPHGLNDPFDFFIALKKVARVSHVSDGSKVKVSVTLTDETKMTAIDTSNILAYTSILLEMKKAGIVK